MDKHIVKRDGEKPLVFAGEEIGVASSYSGQPRWFEVEIYHTDTGRYVVHGVGMSDVEHESDWHWAVICESGEDVVEALYRTNKDGMRYLPRTSQEALAEASERDSGVASAYLQEI